jgi:hypothetical protein
MPFGGVFALMVALALTLTWMAVPRVVATAVVPISVQFPDDGYTLYHSPISEGDELSVSLPVGFTVETARVPTAQVALCQPSSGCWCDAQCGSWRTLQPDPIDVASSQLAGKVRLPMNLWLRFDQDGLWVARVCATESLGGCSFAAGYSAQFTVAARWQPTSYGMQDAGIATGWVLLSVTCAVLLVVVAYALWKRHCGSAGASTDAPLRRPMSVLN